MVGDEAALELEGESVGALEAEEVGRAEGDLPQHHCRCVRRRLLRLRRFDG